MRKGMNLVELAKEIERQENSKQDLIVPTELMQMGVGPDPDNPLGNLRPVMTIDNEEEQVLPVGRIAHDQLSTHYKIPKPYYDRMLESSPELLVRNVNHWLKGSDERRFVRTMDGKMRAFLSDKYRPLDNFLIAKAALPTLHDMNQDQEFGLEFTSIQMTEKRLYIQCVTPKVTEAVKVGDEVQMGIIISNSEVGMGSVRIEPLIWRLICSNGMVRSHALKRHHVGRRLGTDDVLDSQDFYASETVEADNLAFLLKIRDTVKNAFDVLRFKEEVDKLRVAADNKIESKKLDKVVVNVTKKFPQYLTQGDGDSILTNLIEDGDLSQWGLANAVTAMAHDVESHDKAYDVERVGGRIIDLSPSEWKVLTN